MSPLRNLLHHGTQILDILDVTGLVGILYLVVRWRRCPQGMGRGVALALALPAAYFLMITAASMMARTPVSERYYRPVLPLLLVVAAAGFHCLLKAVPKRVLATGIVFVLVAGNLVDMLDEPIRAHRAPQKHAGQWLRRHDPGYNGYVFSDYSQPVYHAGMSYLPAEGALWIMRRLSEGAREVKYAILEKDPVRMRISPGEGGEGEAGVFLPEVEVRTGMQRIDHRWQGLGVEGDLAASGVVFSSPPTYHDPHPGVVRVRRGAGGVPEVRFQECVGQNDRHRPERIRWLAVEPGRWEVDGVPAAVAGAREVGTGDRLSPRRIEFDGAFRRRPVVFVVVQTCNDPSPLTARITAVDRRGFSVFLHRQGATGQGVPEQVGYLAVDPAVRGLGELECRAGWITEDLKDGELIDTGGVRTGLRVRRARRKIGEKDPAGQTIGLLGIGEDPHLLAQVQSWSRPDFQTLRLMPEGAPWMLSYVNKHGWKVIYREPERDLSIYRNPHFRRD